MRNRNGFLVHVDTRGVLTKFCSPSANIETGIISLNEQQTEIYI